MCWTGEVDTLSSVETWTKTRIRTRVCGDECKRGKSELLQMRCPFPVEQHLVFNLIINSAYDVSCNF